MRAFARGTAALLTAAVVLLLCSTPARAGAPDLQISFDEQAYGLPNTCDFSGQAYVNVALLYDGPDPSPQWTIALDDDRQTLGGALFLTRGAVTSGQRVVFSVALLRKEPGAASLLTGTHQIVARAGGSSSSPLSLVIPAALCGAPSGPSSMSGGARPRAAGPPSPYSSSTTARSRGVEALQAAVTLASPSDVRSANGASDCAAHVGVLGALLCPDLVRSGHLLLVWNWRSDAGPDAIDGYRVYDVSGGSPRLITTQANKKDVTLADVPPAAGATGTCYAVSAFSGARESKLSSTFCSGAGSAAKIVTLAATQARGYQELLADNGDFSTSDGRLRAGYHYIDTKHVLGDSFHNEYWRTGVLFDLSSLRGRRVVAAKLRLKIATSDGAGAQYSCATTVGTANGYWWRNAVQFDASFAAGLPAGEGSGPDVAIDVLPIVSRWLGDTPNYGFVLRNDDENPHAFTNKECLTTYVDPELEITYY